MVSKKSTKGHGERVGKKSTKKDSMLNEQN